MITFKAAFACEILAQPHSGPRARWSSGFYSSICTRHMEIFQKNVAAHRARINPLWFLGRRGKETK